ncbi:hypothetical protein QJT78_52890, partial [Bradyrhizobium sp. Mp27]|nr:hypothetical protein [Bradyrhizobium sp. Mp27]
SVIAGLKADWQVEYERWQRRDLSARRYVYIWADGVYPRGSLQIPPGVVSQIPPPARQDKGLLV